LKQWHRVGLNVPYNLEVIGDCGFGFEKNRGDLAGRLNNLDKDENVVKSMGERAKERVKMHYTWEKVISAYEGIFKQING